MREIPDYVATKIARFLRNADGNSFEEDSVVREWIMLLDPMEQLNLREACVAVLEAQLRAADWIQEDDSMSAYADIQGFVDHILHLVVTRILDAPRVVASTGGAILAEDIRAMFDEGFDE